LAMLLSNEALGCWHATGINRPNRRSF